MTEALEGVVPRTDKELSAAYRSPATPLQRTLVDVWRQHLNVEPIGVDDDFFELGGHSLLAADLLVTTELAVGRRVSAKTLYLQPTIAAMAAEIDRVEAEEDGS